MKDYYRYILDPGSTKFICPGHQCGEKTLVRYIDKETWEYIHEQYGRCDRQDSCGYWQKPGKEFYTGDMTYKAGPVATIKRTSINSIGIIPDDILNSTLKGYNQNTFIQNLASRVPYPFDQSDIDEVIQLYKLGTITKGPMASAITFPIIDKRNRVRFIQVKKFKPDNHSLKNREGRPIIDSLTSMIDRAFTTEAKKEPTWPAISKPKPKWLSDYNKATDKIPCPFGAHLLKEFPRNPVALVEAPKTAIYGTLYYGLPRTEKDFIWLAIVALDYLNMNRCKSLRGRTVYLFPDLSGFKLTEKEKDDGLTLDLVEDGLTRGRTFREWRRKAGDISKQVPGLKMKVVDLLEINASEADRKRGLDLADFLEVHDWREFRRRDQEPVPVSHEKKEVSRQYEIIAPTIESRQEIKPEAKPERKLDPNFKLNYVPGSWGNEIEELENFIRSGMLTDGLAPLLRFDLRGDPRKLFMSQFEVAKAQNGNTVYWPYLERANEIMNSIKKRQIEYAN